MQSFEGRPVRSWSEASSGTKIGGQKSHFLRSRSLPRPALLSCPLVPFDAWLSATRCARSRARHTPSPRRLRTRQRALRRNAAVPTMPPWAGASVESCRFAARRSPRGRFWSVSDVRKRLHRTRGGFHRCIHISKVLCTLLLWTMICQRFRSIALWGAPSTGACGLGDYPTPDLSQTTSESRSTSEKSK